jgi:hypothetical protein
LSASGGISPTPATGPAIFHTTGEASYRRHRFERHITAHVAAALWHWRSNLGGNGAHTGQRGHTLAAGVGLARMPPIHLKPGDMSVCSYEGIGTLTNPEVAWK